MRWPLGSPVAVVIPSSTEDVVSIVGMARSAGVPMVPYGAGTGVQAGAAPLAGSMVIDLSQMTQISSISREDRLVRVGPGMLLGALDARASELGLMVGHDPWSQPIASVGGAVSTNGVGYLAGKYGSMGEQVLGLEVVLSTGEVIDIRAVPKASTGPQLRNVFIGAEGTLGIITRVDLRLFPIPEQRTLAGYWFSCFEDGLHAVVEMADIHLRPAMIDYEEDTTQVKPLLGRLVDTPSEMYFAFDGFKEEVAAQAARTDEICRRRGGRPMAASEAQRFWDTRHEPAERYVAQKQIGTPRWSDHWRSSTYLNVTLPVAGIAAFRTRAARGLEHHRLAVVASGLWGIPELFSFRLEHQEPDREDAQAQLDQGADDALRLVHELGGSMEYCHGVGVRLSHLMPAELGAGLDVLRRLKRALDPAWLLNPGKLGL
ncbi:MAG: FAD-binding oxidoreductase [Chloroflexi bacterium]|nr:FAD-binding oxidoreductase [Chloroflexota bacterium]